MLQIPGAMGELRKPCTQRGRQHRSSISGSNLKPKNKRNRAAEPNFPCLKTSRCNSPRIHAARRERNMAAMIGPRVDTPLQPFIFQTYRNRVSVPFEFDFGAAATAGKSVTKANAATKFQCDTVTH